MKAKTRRRHGPRKWRESFTVWIDFIGDRAAVGPLLDHIAGKPSDGGGSFVALPLSDQSWTFSVPTHVFQPLVRDTRDAAEMRARKVFNNLKAAGHRWSPYIRIRLLHDDKPDRCTPPVKYEKVGKTIRVTQNRRPRGPLILLKYQHGKCPDLSTICRPARKAKRA